MLLCILNCLIEHGHTGSSAYEASSDCQGNVLTSIQKQKACIGGQKDDKTKIGIVSIVKLGRHRSE